MMRRSGSMSLHPPPPHLVPPPGGHRIPPPSHPPPYSPLPPPLNKQQQPTHPPVAQVPLLLHRLKIEVNSYEQVKPFRPWEDSRDDQKWLSSATLLEKLQSSDFLKKIHFLLLAKFLAPNNREYFFFKTTRTLHRGNCKP